MLSWISVASTVSGLNQAAGQNLAFACVDHSDLSGGRGFAGLPITENEPVGLR